MRTRQPPSWKDLRGRAGAGDRSTQGRPRGGRHSPIASRGVLMSAGGRLGQESYWGRSPTGQEPYWGAKIVTLLLIWYAAVGGVLTNRR